MDLVTKSLSVSKSFHFSSEWLSSQFSYSTNHFNPFIEAKIHSFWFHRWFFLKIWIKMQEMKCSPYQVSSRQQGSTDRLVLVRSQNLNFSPFWSIPGPGFQGPGPNGLVRNQPVLVRASLVGNIKEFPKTKPKINKNNFVFMFLI